ncbi:MAG: hypothetical protein ACKO9V_00590 [Candidatus Kapaibacterium sp.]
MSYRQHVAFFLRVSVLSIVIASLASCTERSPTAPTVGDSVVVRTVTFTPDSTGPFHFSFDSGVPVIVEKPQESSWDMMVKPVFGGGRTTQIDVLFNSGSVNVAGSTTAYVTDTTFDNVTVADPTLLRPDSLAPSGRIASVDLTGKGIFNYEPAKRSISPNPQKTIILKSSSGALYKVQFISLSVPMSRSELGTFVMRYGKGIGRRLK